MISPYDLTKEAYKIAQRFEKVNTYYIEVMVKHIKEIGQLKPTDIHRLQQMDIMGANIKAINEMLSQETGLALSEIYDVYDRSAYDIYKEVTYLYKAKNIMQVPYKENSVLQNYVRSVKNLTAGSFINMARTTSVQQDYQELVDLAIDSVATGVTDYMTAMRKMVIDKAQKGMRVQYASGRTRRLDSAARMNILEGARQVNIGVREECGKQYGADGIEIDAHGLCAEDHQPYQGRQYTIQEFNKINEKLKRKIGTCNCTHTISYIVLGISPKTYNEKELQQMKNYSNEKVTIGNKEYTRYQASQAMRKLETDMRYKKEEILALQKQGMDTKKERASLLNTREQYKDIASISNLKPRLERARVSGYM